MATQPACANLLPDLALTLHAKFAISPSKLLLCPVSSKSNGKNCPTALLPSDFYSCMNS